MKQSPLATLFGLTALALGTAQIARTTEAAHPPGTPTSGKPASPVAVANPSNHREPGQETALSFSPPTAAEMAVTVPAPVAASPPDHGQLFLGGDRSLVALAVGSAEGTRTPDGGKTRAYYGHVDPGNRVWNLGSFSYQHTARTPEEADRKQLKRLQRQAEILQQKAVAQGLDMTLEEAINGIDLANQAPLAALDSGGYIDRLKQAHDQGLRGADAVLWARTYAFWDSQRQSWDAPGLGNTIHSISHDQERRQNAITRVLARQPQASQPAIANSEKVANDVIFRDAPQTKGPQSSSSTPAPVKLAQPQEQIADQIIAQTLPTPAEKPRQLGQSNGVKKAIEQGIVEILK